MGETNKKLNNLLDNLNDASLRLELVKNEFFGLQNKQFIESRVYEDDETAEDKKTTENVRTQTKTIISAIMKTALRFQKPENELKTDTSEAIIASILKSIDVIDDFYEHVEVSVSDSEDEEDSETTPK